MALINIFTPKAPTMAGYEFDAVLEDTFEAEVELTGYTIELGARASDHRIIKPFKWSLVGAVSNNPLNASVTDFIGALSNNAGGILSTVAGLSAGFLAGSSETRASSTLQFLISLMVTGEPFDIDAGDIQLTNMVIARIRRTKDPENENALIFEADLQEYPTLETTLTRNGATLSQLNPDDPSYSQAVANVNLGELTGTTVTDSIASTIEDLFG